MHQPIEDGLEAYLTGMAGSDSYRGFVAHLDACGECAAEVKVMKQQAEWMRELRTPAETEFELSPGFYARVMERIETQSAKSFWGVFLEPMFGKRLALACLAVFVLLSSAAWQTAETPVATESSVVSILAAPERPTAVGVDPNRDRTVVLTNFASYGSERGPLPLLPVSSD